MNIIEYLGNCRTVGISGHIRPDGDCVGSCLGLALFLKKALPEARVDVFLGDFPRSLRKNMFGTEMIREDYETDAEKYDVFFCLDCEASRLGDAGPYFRGAGLRINIDHHISNAGGCGDLNYVVPEASSACELVYDVIAGTAVFTSTGETAVQTEAAAETIAETAAEKGKTPQGGSGAGRVNTDGPDLLDAQIAQDLYIGMVTDTGVFMYSNTSRKTMETAGRLISFGFDYPAIIREVFYEKTYTQQQILGRALLESIRILDGRCVFAVLSRKTMAFYQATSADLEGVAAQLLLTEGVDCSILLCELKPLNYKISLRSNGAVDVAKVAQQFGGGGHTRAAGCTVNAQWRDIVNQLTKEIERQYSA